MWYCHINVKVVVLYSIQYRQISETFVVERPLSFQTILKKLPKDIDQGLSGSWFGVLNFILEKIARLNEL